MLLYLQQNNGGQNMDAINKKLIELYKKYSSEMEDNKEYYPYLMQCPKEYENANIKIMFVGNDIENFPKIEKKRKVYVEEAIEKNKEQKETPTKRFALLVNKRVNNNHSKGCIVTELFVLGEYTGSSRDIYASDKWEKDNYAILKKEMEICAPDCVVFLTQDSHSSDTFLLKGLLGSDIIFKPNKNCADITLIKNPKIGSKTKISLMIRVPKPNKSSEYLSNEEENIVNISSELIKKIK